MSSLAASLISIQDNIIRYVFPLILVLGNFGNLVAIIILSKRHNRQNPCSLYLLVSSIIGSIGLNWAFGTTLNAIYQSPDPFTVSTVLCKSRSYILQTTSAIYRTMIVLACMDRFAVTSSRVRVRAFSTPKIALKMIGITTAFWMIVSIHLPFFQTIRNNRCLVFGTYGLFFGIHQMCVFGVLLPGLMAVFGILLWKNLRNVRTRVQPHPESNTLQRRDISLIKIVLIEVILVILLSISYPIVTLQAVITDNIMKDDILYDIKWQPELSAPTELENSLLFTSKRKEKYSCVLPTPQTTVTTKPDTVLFSDVEPFIENLHSNKPCTYRLDPYWTYELCHGIHIRQYHETTVAGKKTILQDYFLGYYNVREQDFITNSDKQQSLKIHYKTINHQQIPMLSVRYTSGTNCDINSNKPRETVVFYVCSESGSEGIINFQEVSSCYYEITVTSTKLCNIPEFSPAESNQHTINCYPQENALQKPRNLKKLENEQQLTTKKGPGAQFTMTSADGTTFIISYEYVNEADLTGKIPPSPETEQVPSPPPNTNDGEFLKGFFSGQNCLTGGSGWWRYELCYGKHVIQFHDEPGGRTSVVLGKWNREKHIEWIKTYPKRKLRGNVKERQYLPLYYSEGDQCELTKNPRSVEVKLKCSKRTDKSFIPIMYLVEPETCSYVLGIESPVFCNLNEYTDENGIPNEEKLI